MLAEEFDYLYSTLRTDNKDQIEQILYRSIMDILKHDNAPDFDQPQDKALMPQQKNKNKC